MHTFLLQIQLAQAFCCKNDLSTLFCHKNYLCTFFVAKKFAHTFFVAKTICAFFLLQERFRPESFCALKVSIQKVQTFWADAYYHGMSREISMPVPEPHHPLRANGPFERLCLPLPSLEALWGHACLCCTCLDAPGAFSFSSCCK